MKIVIEPYSEAVAEAHHQFARKMWPSKGRRSNDRLIRYKFRGREKGPVEAYLVAVTESGQVVGVLGVIPGDAKFQAVRVACQWACNLMVDEDYRRQGIASALFRHACSNGRVTLGSSPSASADPTMRRLGFVALEGPRVMVMPLDPAEVFRWKMPGHPAAARLAGAVAMPVALVHRWRCWAVKGGRAVGCRWQEIRERLHAYEENLDTPHVVHTDDWLDWRCDGLEGFNPRLEGLIAGKRSWALVGRMGRHFNIYDWHAEDRSAMEQLIRAAYEMARAGGASVIRTMAQDPLEQSWLTSMGFMAMRTPVTILCDRADFAGGGAKFRYALYDSDGDL